MNDVMNTPHNTTKTKRNGARERRAANPQTKAPTNNKGRKADKASRDAALAKNADELRKAEQEVKGKPRHHPETLEVHELADRVPKMSTEEFDKFRNDVKQNGLSHPVITLFEGKILDGRHRDRVCREFGIPRKFETYKGTDPAGFVISENVMRRQLQLNDDQRVALVTKIRAPRLEAEAKDRMTMALRKGDTAGMNSHQRARTREKIAEEADTTEHKATQALKVFKAGELDNVIDKKKDAEASCCRVVETQADNKATAEGKDL